MIQYRLATANDCQALARLRWEWKMEENPIATIPREDFLRECEAFIRDGITTGGWAHWLAVENDRLLTVASVCRVPKIPHPRPKPRWLGYVTNVCTVPDRRGQGIGRRLMELLVEWARAEGCDTLILWPDSRRTAFYKRCGFRGNTEVMEHTLGSLSPCKPADT